jgi:phospholipid transport system substrate-binding protein
MRKLEAVTPAVLMVLWLASWAAHAVQDPLQLVESTTDRVLAKLGAEGETPEPLAASRLIEDLVAPHFDMVRMSKWVIGKHWRNASAEQRQRFIAEFRALLIRTYAVALAKYTEQTILYHPARFDGDGTQVTIKTEIIMPAGPPIPMDYRMYLRDGQWKVFDVAIEGISLVSTYRSSFAAEIRRSGLDKLIEDLALRNQRGSAS